MRFWVSAMIGCAACSASEALDAGTYPNDAQEADADARVTPEPTCDPDAGSELPDATALPSIQDTVLATTPIAWRNDLELCSRWSGRPIAEERLAKAHLTLHAALRPSLAEADLARATLAGGYVRRGPLADQQTTINTATSSLTRYEVLRSADTVRLHAEIRHRVAAGTIIEHFDVRREPNDLRPVTFDDALDEHVFSFEPAGSTVVTRLETCGGSPNLELGIFGLHLQLGERHATLLRFARTEKRCDGRSPMIPIGGMFIDSVSYSDGARYMFDGYWSQTYAAAAGNTEDQSHFDLTGDVGLYETIYTNFGAIFGPARPEMITSIQLDGVDGAAPHGTATIITLNTQTQESTTEVWTTDRWFRADETELLRDFDDCPATVTTLLYDYRNALQLVVCPQADPPGFDLRAVVPLTFSAEPGAIGRLVEGDAITETVVDKRSGYNIAIGDHVLEIVKDTDIYWHTIRDRQGVVASTSGGFPGSIETTLDVDTVVSSTVGVKSTVKRRWASQGYGATQNVVPILFELDFAGEHHHVEAWDRMEYTNSHHGWSDRLVGHVDGLTLFWSADFDYQQPPYEFVYTVSATRDVDDVEVLPPTVVKREP